MPASESSVGLLGAFVLYIFVLPVEGYTNISTYDIDNNTATHRAQIEVVRWDFHKFSTQITVILFLLIMIMIKLAFHRIPYMVDHVPESLLLLGLGIVFGAVVRHEVRTGSFEQSVWNLTPQLFFNYLLPPIVLESSYSLYNRTFGEYLGDVLIFAVLGTVFNFLFIGFFLYGIGRVGALGGLEERFDLNTLLLFSSLIVAVDPVAVLAIFQDIGVELSLYYIVFGESLLNDAITVVLYEIMATFAGQKQISVREIGLGIASFYTVSLGGLLIGVIVGIVSCLVTRIRSRLHACTLILLAYFAYIIADTVGWSGIISMIGCGLMQAAYAFHNLDRNSVIVVHKLMKNVSDISESVIFLFLGVEVFGANLQWHTDFILWALLACLIARMVCVFGISAVLNALHSDGQKLSFAEQVILIHGGLRGAVAFSLAILIREQSLGEHGDYNRRLIITTTLFIIVFTVCVMGLTMKPLVKALKIRMQTKENLSLFNTMANHVLDETLAAVEVITNTKGPNLLRDICTRLDDKYLRRILQRDTGGYDQQIMKVYEKINLDLHYAAMEPHKTDHLLRHMPERMRNMYLNRIQSAISLPALLPPVASMASQLSDHDREMPVEVVISSPSRRTDDREIVRSFRSSRRATIALHDKRQIDFGIALREVIACRKRMIAARFKQPAPVVIIDAASQSRGSSDKQEERVIERKTPIFEV